MRGIIAYGQWRAAVVVFLVWVYVQAAILIYGVEFTSTYETEKWGYT